jgi:hypothetical protein
MMVLLSQIYGENQTQRRAEQQDLENLWLAKKRSGSKVPAKCSATQLLGPITGRQGLVAGLPVITCALEGESVTLALSSALSSPVSGPVISCHHDVLSHHRPNQRWTKPPKL